jgi:hypothetical protein
MIAVERDSAIDDLSSTPVSFKSEMIDKKINIEIPGQPDKGRHHLFTGADRIDHLIILIQAGIRAKYIIDEKGNISRDPGTLDVGAEYLHPGSSQYLCGNEIVSRSHLRG